MIESSIDPTLYGGAPIPEELKYQQSEVTPPATPDELAAGTVPAGTGFANTPEAAIGAAVRAEGSRVKADIITSMIAGAKLGTTASILEAITMPHFSVQEGFNTREHFKQVPFALTHEEVDFLQKSVSDDAWQYRIGRIQELRDQHKEAGDHPWLSMVPQILDPVQLGADWATAGASRILSLGRIGADIAGAAATVPVQVAASVATPMATREIITNALLNGAVTALAYRPAVRKLDDVGNVVVEPGGVVKAEPNFPGKELTAIANTTAPKPKVRMVSPAQYVDEVVPAVAEVRGPAAPLKALDTAKPNYGNRGDNFRLTFNNPIDKAAYILAGSGKSASHDKILAWAKQVSGLSEQELIDLGTKMRGNLNADTAAVRKGGPAINGSIFDNGTIKVGKHFNGQLQDVVHTPARPATTVRKKVSDATWEVVDAGAQAAPAAVQAATKAAQAAAQATVNASASVVSTGTKSWGQRFGEKLMWNMHKTLSNMGTAGKRVADLLIDNNADLSLMSVESHARGLRQDLGRFQRLYEDELQQSMAARGAGIVERFNPVTAKRAMAVQRQIQQELKLEMLRRQKLTRQGRHIDKSGVAPEITRMADRFDQATSNALREAKAAGVKGTEALNALPGYFSRKLSLTAIESAHSALRVAGHSEKQADQAIKKLMADGLRRANPSLDATTAYDIGAAMINRTMRKGYLEDAAFNMFQGNGTLKYMRDLLKEEGLAPQRIDRAMSILEGKNAEAGKASFLRHRMELDHEASITVGNTQISVADLIDSNLTTGLDSYLDRMAGLSAMARNGLADSNAVGNLRNELLHGISNPKERAKAAELFDNITAAISGAPAGGKMSAFMRGLGMVGRMLSLRNAGLWQITEYVKMAQTYGVMQTTKVALQTVPVLSKLWRSTAGELTDGNLVHVLTRHSSQDMRLRPFIERFEDGFEMTGDETVLALLKNSEQLVPYINGMKFIHHHQAEMAANLITSRLQQATKGNAKALAMLSRYGIDSHVIGKLRTEISAHGMNTDAWAPAVWQQVRPAVSKMMDESILHARLGDMPAFAKFDPVGKFVYTYRSFMLTAHNKLLAGTLAREGPVALGTMMMYQLPLAALTVKAQAALQGKDLKDNEVWAKSASQMGSLGMLSEAMAWVSGQKGSVGAPGLIPLDRGVKAIGTISNFAQGSSDGVAVAKAIGGLVPLYQNLPIAR